MEHRNDVLPGDNITNASRYHVYNTTCYRGLRQGALESYVRFQGYNIRYPCAEPGSDSGEPPQGLYITDPSNATFPPDVVALREEARHNSVADENIAVGLMFASKAIVQLIANPIIGPLTNR